MSEEIKISKKAEKLVDEIIEAEVELSSLSADPEARRKPEEFDKGEVLERALVEYLKGLKGEFDWVATEAESEYL